MLQAPGFEQVLEWRNLQEEKLRARAAKDASGIMDRVVIERFIQHFERLTRHCLQTLPDSADRVFRLDAEHRIHVS
jgi:D-glycerate 3-kinase